MATTSGWTKPLTTNLKSNEPNPSTATATAAATKGASTTKGDEIKVQSSPPPPSSLTGALSPTLKYFLTLMRGEMVVVQTVDGRCYEGLFHTFESTGEPSMVMRMAQQQLEEHTQKNKMPRRYEESDEAVRNTIHPFESVRKIPLSQLVQLFASDLSLAQWTQAYHDWLQQHGGSNGIGGGKMSHSRSGGFATDSQISGPSDKERELVRWDHGGAGDGGLEDLSLNEKRGNSGGSFNQFETFERMTGKTTTFNFDDYSTKLDKTSSFYKSNEARAAAIANAIKASEAGSEHQRLEREGQDEVTVRDRDMDEGDLFSDVRRENGTGAAAAAAPNSTGKYKPGAFKQKKLQEALKSPEAASTTATAPTPARTPVTSPTKNTTGPANTKTPNGATPTPVAATPSASPEVAKSPKAPSPAPAKPVEEPTTKEPVSTTPVTTAAANTATTAETPTSTTPATTTTTDASTATTTTTATAPTEAPKKGLNPKAKAFNPNAPVFVPGAGAAAVTPLVTPPVGVLPIPPQHILQTPPFVPGMPMAQPQLYPQPMPIMQQPPINPYAMQQQQMPILPVNPLNQPNNMIRNFPPQPQQQQPPLMAPGFFPNVQPQQLTPQQQQQQLLLAAMAFQQQQPGFNFNNQVNQQLRGPIPMPNQQQQPPFQFNQMNPAQQLQFQQFVAQQQQQQQQQQQFRPSGPTFPQQQGQPNQQQFQPQQRFQ